MNKTYFGIPIAAGQLVWLDPTFQVLVFSVNPRTFQTGNMIREHCQENYHNVHSHQVHVAKYVYYRLGMCLDFATICQIRCGEFQLLNDTKL